MNLWKVGAIVVPLLALVATAQPIDARAETAFWMTGVISDPATRDPACGGLRIAKSTGTLRGVPLGRAAWTGTECIADRRIDQINAEIEKGYHEDHR